MVIVLHPTLYIANVQSFVFVVPTRLSFSNVEYENLLDSVRKSIQFRIHPFDISHFSFAENNSHTIVHHYPTTWQSHEHYFQKSFARNRTPSMATVIRQQCKNKSYFPRELSRAKHWCIREGYLSWELNEHECRRKVWRQRNDFDEHFQAIDHLEWNYWDERVESNRIHRRQYCSRFSIENLPTRNQPMDEEKQKPWINHVVSTYPTIALCIIMYTYGIDF